jgi:hypothetical protein
MIKRENEKLSIKRKIVLSLGFLVAALTLIFAQYSGVKAKPDYDVKTNVFIDKSIEPDFKKLREPKELNIDSLNAINKNKKIRKNTYPVNNSYPNNRIFESI